MMCFMDYDRVEPSQSWDGELPPAFRVPPAAPPGTPIGQLTATGTGEVRDIDGNLLDNAGRIVPQVETE